MKQMKVLEVVVCYERLHHFERRRWTVNHCDCHTSIQGHDGTRLNNLKKVIEPENLMPIRVLGASRPAVHSHECCLERERSGSPLHGLLDKRQSLLDLDSVPETAMLRLQEDEVACRIAARIAARVVEEHQRQKSG